MAHDAHNIVIAGVNDDDMAVALRAVVDAGGGLAAVAEGQALAVLPLPIAGLMSDAPIQKVCQHLTALGEAAGRLGSPLDSPFMTLSFLALPVIPELKITDQGLVDVRTFEFVPLFL